MKDEMKISVENAIKAYNGADANGKKMLESLFGKEVFQPKDIRERIKTFEDAMNELGSEHKLVTLYESFMKDIPEKDDSDNDVTAYLKLRIIVAALNEGWVPQFTEDELRWYPYFWFYTKEEWDNLGDEVKKYGRVLGRSYYLGNVSGGLAYANVGNASSSSRTYSGSRLAFKSEDLALYCGKQFSDIWIDFLIGCGHEE